MSKVQASMLTLVKQQLVKELAELDTARIKELGLQLAEKELYDHTVYLFWQNEKVKRELAEQEIDGLSTQVLHLNKECLRLERALKKAQHGLARPGMARQGKAGQGKARFI